jgi:hypothetical protein
MVVEGTLGFDIHRTADAFAVHVRSGDFDDLDRIHRVRRDHVERNAAIAFFRTGKLKTIELHRVERVINAADHNVPALPLITVERKPGNALQRLGGILVGKTADFV